MTAPAETEPQKILIVLHGSIGDVTRALPLASMLRRRFPQLLIPFAWSPPFRALEPAEERSVREAIALSGVRILFVGLGCPKQERWMAAQRDALGCVLVGVGAAFDFLAGGKPQAPAWMQERGLEWLFRLGSEPRRLWRRYLVGNARFLFHFLVRRNPDPWPSRLVFW